MTTGGNFEELSMETHCKSIENEISSLTEDLPKIYEKYLKKSSDEKAAILNFNVGFTANSLEKIIQNNNMHEARECIRKHQERALALRTDCPST